MLSYARNCAESAWYFPQQDALLNLRSQQNPSLGDVTTQPHRRRTAQQHEGH
jgi:hypothetical protein